MSEVEQRVQIQCGPMLLDFGTVEEFKTDAVGQARLKRIEREIAECGIQFFMPHGTEKTGVVVEEPDGERIDLSGDAGGWPVVSTLHWLNAEGYDIWITKSPNQTGKTTLAVVWVVFEVIKTNPEWLCFRKHGIRRREWRGPQNVLCLGYDRGHLERVLWPELQKWIPDVELGPYRSRLRGGTQEPAWDRRPSVPLTCGSELFFLTYEQRASTIAGLKIDKVLADEQMPEEHWSELRPRGQTRGKRGIQVVFPYTPHQVDGRPDTGANSFLADIWSGKNTFGRRVIRTRMSIADVPDHIISPEQKKLAYEDCIVIPKQRKDDAAIRRGRARYWGLDEEETGRFYPEFSRQTHVIPWGYEDVKKLPGHFERFMDHGWAAPSTCLWVWVSTFGEFVIYDEYYVSQKLAYEHAQAIIRQSGNLVHMTDRVVTTTDGSLQECKERRPSGGGGEVFTRTELDYHCFAQDGSGLTIADYYRLGGLTVMPSTTAGIEPRSMALRMLLRVDPYRRHLVTGEAGAPRLYVSDRCRWLIDEMETCMRDSRVHGEERYNPKETRKAKNDHAIDAAEYMAMRHSFAMGMSPEKMRKKVVWL